LQVIANGLLHGPAEGGRWIWTDTCADQRVACACVCEHRSNPGCILQHHRKLLRGCICEFWSRVEAAQQVRLAALYSDCAAHAFQQNNIRPGSLQTTSR